MKAPLDFFFSRAILKSEKERERKESKVRENVDVEFKELDRMTGKLPDSISKEIISFANTEGGEIYIGIRDDQIVITLKPKGVYVRRGTACIPLNKAGIRQMILETSGKSFEESRSLNQDLTFHTLESSLKEKRLEFGAEQMKTLKLVGEDGLYTNLALLLSDQCQHTIKVAVFQGSDSAVFRDRKEFTGSVLKQLEDVYSFLDVYNKTEAFFAGLKRTDHRDYPEEAIREALLNSILHRDYLFSGSTIINVFDDHIEFISLGGLVSGISMEAVFMGASQSRNPNLAAVFYRLGLVESYGTGVRKILRLYKDSEQKPVFKAAEGVFSVEMVNRNEAMRKPSGGQISGNNTESEDKNDAVYQFVRKNGETTRKDIEEAFGVGSTKAYKMLKQLCDDGRLFQKMNGRKTTYIIN